MQMTLQLIFLWITCFGLYEAVILSQLCKNRQFGFKAQDPFDCHGFYVCLGEIGQFSLDCGREYRFNETIQRCVPGKCPPCPCTVSDSFPQITGFLPIILNPMYYNTMTYGINRDVKPCNSGVDFNSLGNAALHKELQGISDITNETDQSDLHDNNSNIIRHNLTHKKSKLITSDTSSICLNKTNGSFEKDPSNCSVYYICYDNNAYAQICPGMLQFDRRYNMCNMPEIVNCNQANVENSTSATTLSTPLNNKTSKKIRKSSTEAVTYTTEITTNPTTIGAAYTTTTDRRHETTTETESTTELKISNMTSASELTNIPDSKTLSAISTETDHIVTTIIRPKLRQFLGSFLLNASANKLPPGNSFFDLQTQTISESPINPSTIDNFIDIDQKNTFSTEYSTDETKITDPEEMLTTITNESTSSAVGADLASTESVNQTFNNVDITSTIKDVIKSTVQDLLPHRKSRLGAQNIGKTTYDLTESTTVTTTTFQEITTTKNEFSDLTTLSTTEDQFSENTDQKIESNVIATTIAGTITTVTEINTENTSNNWDNTDLSTLIAANPLLLQETDIISSDLKTNFELDTIKNLANDNGMRNIFVSGTTLDYETTTLKIFNPTTETYFSTFGTETKFETTKIESTVPSTLTELSTTTVVDSTNVNKIAKNIYETSGPSKFFTSEITTTTEASTNFEFTSETSDFTTEVQTTFTKYEADTTNFLTTTNSELSSKISVSTKDPYKQTAKYKAAGTTDLTTTTNSEIDWTTETTTDITITTDATTNSETFDFTTDVPTTILPTISTTIQVTTLSTLPTETLTTLVTTKLPTELTTTTDATTNSETSDFTTDVPTTILPTISTTIQVTTLSTLPTETLTTLVTTKLPTELTTTTDATTNSETSDFTTEVPTTILPTISTTIRVTTLSNLPTETLTTLVTTKLPTELTTTTDATTSSETSDFTTDMLTTTTKYKEETTAHTPVTTTIGSILPTITTTSHITTPSSLPTETLTTQFPTKFPTELTTTTKEVSVPTTHTTTQCPSPTKTSTSESPTATTKTTSTHKPATDPTTHSVSETTTTTTCVTTRSTSAVTSTQCPSITPTKTSTSEIPTGTTKTTSTHKPTTDPTTHSVSRTTTTTTCVTTRSTSPVTSATPTTEICLNRRDGEFVRDFNDCNKFYTCFQNLSYLQKCPAGLYFDTVLNVCNYPHLVNCPAAPIITPAPNPSCTTPKDTLTPEDCYQLPGGTFVRDPLDCNIYYVCLNGKAIKLQCPRGQYFDNEHFVCNFKYFVSNCKV
ncbi:uncharacterized protein [Musca autumnalis]|uniref:uncharacterized protein n=1 Tax=Musca autumnalis TaxID=221902 RepID=UPI003CFB6D8A